MAATDSLPIPRKNSAYRVYFPINKNDGTLITTWAGMDSEVSQDGGNFADCTSEATEIQTSGIGYLDLTSTEMNADTVIIKITVTNTSALPQILVLYPEETGDIRVHVTQMAAGVIAAASFAANALDAVWSTATRSLTTYGTLTTDTATAVWANVTRTLTSGAANTSDIADAVWNRLTTAVATSGSIGKYILDKLALLGASGATILTPMLSNGKVTVKRGDSFTLGTANHVLTWHQPDTGLSWPDAVPDTVTLYVIGEHDSANALELEGVYHEADTAYVTVELSAEDSTLLDVDRAYYYHYELVAVYDDGTVFTMAENTWTSLRKYRVEA